MTTTSSSESLVQFIERVEIYLDKVVEIGSDQELFISSYLQGHFAVMAGQSQVQNMQSVAELDGLMQDSLHKAFANQELADDDQQQVFALWQSLLAKG